jgi:integrase
VLLRQQKVTMSLSLPDFCNSAMLATLKQRQEKAERGPGAPAKNIITRRQVTLSDAQFISQFNSMVATLRIPKERRNPSTDRMEPVRIWSVTDRTVRTWLNDAVARAAADGVTFSIPVTPHTLRHSYAMHMLYSGVPLKVLQALMGHKSMKSTEVYTKVFALDVAARYRVQFSVKGTEAVALLKNNDIETR